MNIILGFVVVIALAVGGYWLNLPEEPTFVPVPDNATLRKTTSGNLLGYTGANGAWIWQGVRFAKAPRAPCVGVPRCPQATAQRRHY